VRANDAPTPEPPSELLLSTADLLAVRVHGRPRDPGNGQHKRAVIYCDATMSAHGLARHLRDAADRLELEGREVTT
jgi:hypothetical protein